MTGKRILKVTLNGSIVLFVFLLFFIIHWGGIEVSLFGWKVKAKGISNPVVILSLLLLLRFCLAIGRRNSLLLGFALLSSCLLTEILLRVVHSPMTLPALKDMTQPSDILGYRLVPLLEDSKISTNSHGLRDRERTWKKPDGVKRLLGIGDSFTFGYGVRLEDSYLKQIEKRLNRDGGTWDVINAGVSGYNMWQYLAYFKHVGFRYQPDLVTVGLYFDDFYGDPSSGPRSPETQRHHSLSFLRLVNFGRNSLELLKFRYRYLLDAGWLKSVEDRRRYILNSHESLLLSGRVAPEVYKKFESRLGRLAELVKDHHSKLILFFIPDVSQLHYPGLQALNGILAEMCSRLNVNFLDMTPFFEQSQDIRSLYLLPWDAHTSPAGHRLMALELEKQVRAVMGEEQSPIVSKTPYSCHLKPPL